MKCLIVVLFAVILAANAQQISLADMLKAYKETNEIDCNTQVAQQALYIPMTLKACENTACNSICQAIGFKHGTCISSASCKCYN